jgi:hypothetical protein
MAIRNFGELHNFRNTGNKALQINRRTVRSMNCAPIYLQRVIPRGSKVMELPKISLPDLTAVRYR